ncbi:hypothetical protein COLO4_16785 [Corchorus olitorius]|uniref:Pentatricopeptide repeat-containing protein n=1 Tax=Corchorus olitorius TaxID=93759 RepID=A0A1R3JFK4_9ROSI|nr:hypothetical protein COLO4_16785 [Corchorus olitorius]
MVTFYSYNLLSVVLEHHAQLGKRELRFRDMAEDILGKQNLVSAGKVSAEYDFTDDIDISRETMNDIENLHMRPLLQHSGMRKMRGKHAKPLLDHLILPLQESNFFAAGDEPTIVDTAMIAGYANYGYMESAKELYERMVEKNSVAWLAMIAGYGKCGEYINTVFGHGEEEVAMEKPWMFQVQFNHITPPLAFWYPVAFSTDLKEDTMIPIDCFEEPCVAFCGNDGNLG